MTYEATRERLENYFDKTAAQTWERLTSDAPVSKVRQTVREGRDRMRGMLLGALPDDLTGARVLDAGCGAGQTAIELAERGADVVAIDISPSLIGVAQQRTPDGIAHRIDYRAGDMLDPDLGTFDSVIAMDSLIHYDAGDIVSALDGLAKRTRENIAFTIAPRTSLLLAMWWAGKAFPKSDRSPAIRPHRGEGLAQILRSQGSNVSLRDLGTVSSGFYISQAWEARG